MWKDERLTWDPTKFGGIDKLSVNSNQVNTKGFPFYVVMLTYADSAHF